VLVAGGSLGARTLNETALAAWAESGPAILHICGERDYEQLRGRVTRPDYRLLPFVDDYGAALGAADVVVSRAGGSVWEIAAAGKPAILVPYPDATADHQRKNAEYFARAGGAVIVPDAEAGEQVPVLVAELLADPDGLERRAEAMRAAAKPQAAEEIANELIALATARR
jgi:UDP-N-acetylglucosamine--N-acetylmuramyl-(pentapeptide) pyrophosphoryl-undecaprenol N-acetylglucosamine transferase